MNNNMNQVVAYNLKVARIRFDWSQAFVSNLTGLSIRSISRAETGHSVSKSTLKRLCALYHIDISSLYEPAFLMVIRLHQISIRKNIQIYRGTALVFLQIWKEHLLMLKWYVPNS